MAIPTEPARWRRSQSTEARASRCAPASSPRYRLAEYIGFTAVVVTELEFREVQRKVLCADVMISADDSALQECPEALNIVRVNFTTHILASRVHYGFVVVAQRVQVVIAAVFIGRDKRDTITDRLAHESTQRCRVGILNDLADHVALAADSADHGGLSAHAGDVLLLIPVAILVLAADCGFIHLDDAHQLAELAVFHRSSKPHAHIPDSFVSAGAEHSMKLPSAHSFLAHEHQVQDFKPHEERLLGFLEDGSGFKREAVRRAIVLAALLALPVPCASRAALVNVIVAATWALWASRPASQHEIGPTRCFVGKRRIELRKRHLLDEYRIAVGCHAQILAQMNVVVKCPIIPLIKPLRAGN